MTELDASDLMALAAEELDPELAQWVEDGPLGPMLKHPLVYDITGTHIPGLPNRQFRRKEGRAGAGHRGAQLAHRRLPARAALPRQRAVPGGAGARRRR
jgi:hypothetical protein